MSDPIRSRSDVMAYAAAGMEPPPVVPLRKNDPTRVGPYVLVSVLGSGGMGRVYLGRNTTGGPGQAAVKVVRPEYAEDPLFRKRFEREVSALGRVQGAHTARLLGSGTDEDLVWVATEYIPGPTLAEAVDGCGPMDAEAAWRLTADLGRAVEAVWRQGIVHRDLKPSNVILAADGARVIDFGVVQATDGTSITATGQNVGTPAFMSPEQVRGKEVTAASDVFSLASTLAYAVTGKTPFGEGTGVDVLHRVAFDPPREDVLEKVAATDPELAAFVRACLDKDPTQRPAPDAVFRTAIGHQLSAPVAAPPRPTRRGAFAPAPAPPATPEDPPATPAAPASRKRRRALVGAAATVAVLVAGGATAALLSQGDDPPATGSSPRSSPSVTGRPASAATTSSTVKPGPTLPAKASDSPGGSGDTAPTPVASPADIRSTACPAQITSGAHGACVTALQNLLAGYGLEVTVDGRFGAATLAAVRVFQAEAGTTVDGKVGSQTKKLLYGQPRGPVRSGAVTVTESVNAAPVARCLSAGTNAADIQVWGCTGAGTQKWALYPVPARPAEYTVVNRGSHLCLDADIATTGRNGQGIHGRTCDGLPAQRWALGDSGPNDGRTLVSVPDGFCLDAEASASGEDGQRVQGFGCAGSSNQVWSWS